MRSLLAATAHYARPDEITFILCAVIIVFGAFGVVTSKNPVHAALSLVLTLFGVAILFVEQQADFLAAVQVIVYAGAIVVLFLFVIMYLGVDRRDNEEAEQLVGQRMLAGLALAVILASLAFLAVNAHWKFGAHAVAGSTTAGHHSNVYLLGHSVFSTYLFAFEITSGLLVIAVVGAVVLARRPPSPLSDDPDQESESHSGHRDAELASESSAPSPGTDSDPEFETAAAGT